MNAPPANSTRRLKAPTPVDGRDAIALRRHVPWRQVLLCVAGLLGAYASAVAGQPLAPRDPEPDVGKEEQVQNLAKRLIKGERLPDDAMARIIERMARVEQRLGQHFDAGTETQGWQRQIVDDLDAAIRSAIRGRAGGSAGVAGESDKRRRGQKPPAGPGERDGSSESVPDADTTSANVGEEEADRWGPLNDSRRGWGHLPPRDRDEVIQGAGEESLEKFRSWIERYYRALAEDGQP